MGRITFLFVIAAFVLIFSVSNAKAYSFEEQEGNLWATLLAPVVDYGIFNERSSEVKKKPQSQGITMTSTPPPGDDEEGSNDPKPPKPHDRPGIPVDPSFLDQPLACTATVVDASAAAGNEDESFVVVNPTNTQNIVVFSNLDANSIHRSYTTNGGTNWTHGTVATNVACCDAQAAWDSFGNLFMVYISASGGQINIINSTDGGTTFTPRSLRATAAAPTNPPSRWATAASGWTGTQAVIWSPAERRSRD